MRRPVGRSTRSRYTEVVVAIRRDALPLGPMQEISAAVVVVVDAAAREQAIEVVVSRRSRGAARLDGRPIADAVVGLGLRDLSVHEDAQQTILVVVFVAGGRPRRPRPSRRRSRFTELIALVEAGHGRRAADHGRRRCDPAVLVVRGPNVDDPGMQGGLEAGCRVAFDGERADRRDGAGVIAVHRRRLAVDQHRRYAAVCIQRDVYGPLDRSGPDETDRCRARVATPRRTPDGPATLTGNAVTGS